MVVSESGPLSSSQGPQFRLHVYWKFNFWRNCTFILFKFAWIPSALNSFFSNICWIPIIFSNLNSNCSNLWGMRNLQEQVKKAFCYQKLFWPFTVWINCSSDLKLLQILCLQPQILKVLQEHFCFSQKVRTILETKYVQYYGFINLQC